MSDQEMLHAVERLKNLARMASETVSPFAKANLAEKAVSEVVTLLDELVKRATQ